jgi:hypothetical protein
MDNPVDPDFMDTTGEDMSKSSLEPKTTCFRDGPSIRCLDISCRHWLYPCSDRHCSSVGSCRTEHRNQFDRFLVAHTTNSHLSDECWSTMICRTGAIPTSLLVRNCILLFFILMQNIVEIWAETMRYYSFLEQLLFI